MNKKKPIFLLSLGCSKNTVDSERILYHAEANGFTFTQRAEDASVIIINTCGFIADAKEESVNEILAAADMRRNGEIEALYVTGCLSALYRRELQAELPEVDRFFGTSDLEEIIRELGGTSETAAIHKRTLLTPPHYAWLKIGEGCSRTCSFCAIPKMRGRHASRTMESLVTEAAMLLQMGVKEINIISQDITQYGWDTHQRSLLDELLVRLADLGTPWLRLLYAYPQNFPVEVIDTMRKTPSVCNYLDIPVQHISDRILTSMNRGISKEQTMRLLESIREKNPEIALRTTMIVGYPGETRREFEELLRFVESFRFERLGCFAYSHEEHTSAYRELEDTIPPEEKEARVKELMELQEGIAASVNRKLEGKSVEIMIDEIQGTTALARTRYDAPEVDNECIINIGNDMTPAPGELWLAEVTDSSAYELYGNLLAKR